ncbi:MAG: DUF58 domain-containing protein [Thermomicrobia bacterium]|nr:DUF58 domain-containing protein [Thermomicrobia bacterium]MCA1725117.1 DUF58 domain-containing protein [Thermomicrobia bacterium]
MGTGAIYGQAWVTGSVIVILLGMLLGQPAVTVIGTITLLTLALSWFWNKHVLDRLLFERNTDTDRCFAGESLHLTLRMTNKKLLPMPWVRVEDAVASRVRVRDWEAFQSESPGTQIVSFFTALRWYERITWHLTLQCPHRGYFRVGPVTIRAGDPFGFFAHRQSLPGEQYLTVYPRLVPLDELGLPPRHLLGETNVRRTVITDPTRIVGTREYHPEDPFKAIHWKASARAGVYQTKVYEPTANLQIAIFLNLDTVARYYEGVDQEHLERAISVAASIAAWADTEKYAVGVFANGLLAQTDQTLRIPPGRREDQYARILEGLARLTPFTYVNIAGTLEQESPRFPWGSTVIVVTMTMTDTLRRALANLVQRGLRVVIIALGFVDDPGLSGVLVHRLPWQSVEAATKDAGLRTED